MLFRQIIDPRLAQYAYLIGCQQTGEALIIDPERDIDRYLNAAEAEGLTITAVAETHIHADFLSGAREFAERGVRVYVSDEGDENWRYVWTRDSRYDVEHLKDGDSFKVGNIELRAVHTPGHTPEHLSFLVTDHGGGGTEPMGIVTGDFVFVGDLGRPDLLESAARVEGQMKPSARRLYSSVQRFLDLPDYLQLWPGHGAGSACGKSLGAVPQSTIGYERRFNPAIESARHGEVAFVDAILGGQNDPPLYFARMKQLNRDGVPLLEQLPAPERVTPDRLAHVLEVVDPTPIDTRLDRAAFMAWHLPRSLYAPLNKNFNTNVGSIADPDAALLIVMEADQVEEAVRDLVRVGYDHVNFYITPDDLDEYFERGGDSASIDRIDFETFDERREDPRAVVLDVRYASEYASVHVPDAINIAHTRLADRLDEVPEANRLLVHCSAGSRSAVAAALLARNGFETVFVDGEFADWVRAHPDTAEHAGVTV